MVWAKLLKSFEVLERPINKVSSLVVGGAHFVVYIYNKFTVMLICGCL